MSRLAYERAIRRSGLKPPSRHLALTIATWAGIADGVIPDRFQPALTTLEEATGLTRKSVRTHLDTLEETGWIARERPTADAARRGARTHYRLLIPAGATVADDADSRGGDPLPHASVGDEIPQGGGAHPPAVGDEIPQGRGPRPPKSPLSSRSANQSPGAEGVADRDPRPANRGNGTTKNTSITSDLDAAADAARQELSRAARRDITPAWARKVAAGILDAAGGPVDRPAGYVRSAIRNEADVARFLPTATATSHTHEATEPTPGPARPNLTLHNGTGRRRPTGDVQPPLLASVIGDALEDAAPVTGPSADAVHRHADHIRATLAAKREQTS